MPIDTAEKAVEAVDVTCPSRSNLTRFVSTTSFSTSVSFGEVSRPQQEEAMYKNKDMTEKDIDRPQQLM
eukprot:CAMPEP_0176175520 /NCGR_PEP_ID=MMETSP0120_2-20121206/89918_1 /TAXON_ID=160619 /ORGANISM="Kryptoperidinium foliaceum, Strain CCMP 1326" /LENGTH=68 /DNA_ID=CAMNT_0017513569 /DNA_START=93 /DNA_END=299 /DNA_ORIENTATION=+